MIRRALGAAIAGSSSAKSSRSIDAFLAVSESFTNLYISESSSFILGRILS